LFKNQSGKEKIVVDERPSERGRYPEKTGTTHLRCARNVAIDASFMVDDNMKEMLA
jgi:hypothetical protein